MADPKERAFQQTIIDELAASGWLVGSADKYDRERALYPEDVIGYFQEAHPDQWERFAKHNARGPEKALLDHVARELDKVGTLEVLRHGFRTPGAKVELATFKPDHAMNQTVLERYRQNRLRVVPELSYSPHAKEGEYNPRLDLALFVNGLPVATAELKSEFQQSVDQAIRQYKHDRQPKAKSNGKQEPLLKFKRGALVHFAVSQDQVAMTTRLQGKATSFLPFNRGTAEGGAGNPPSESEDAYATSYLWREVLQPDNWLHILGRFLHLEQKTHEDFHGRRTKKEALIFPRYHQWKVVTRLIEATRREGPGRCYLIQHSAGSGKSNSIAWSAHQLASLYNEHGDKLFDSVIVVTDRNVLDQQLQQTIYQFEHASGVVRPITGGEGTSKSEQLAQALKERTRIIVVTIQTFPALFDALDRHKDLAAGKYAVIADEAHSSQTGASAHKLKALLGVERSEAEEISAEELLDAALAARGSSDRISYYAFTATPKARTLEMFGRPPDPSRGPASDNLPEPFHVYSMRQAIEEGFILDVLQNYITYKTAFRLAHPRGEAYEVDAREASSKIARWVRLHEYNIEQKVEVIVEHFRDHVRHLLDGQAKAMVVTSSRREAVRYQLAMRKYIDQQGYTDVHPLVAFSGQVEPDDVIPQPVDERSSLLNPGLKARDHRDAFDTDDFNVMIAANKFQTGFDQPKLCAMYVDKRLQGVDCVQTLSRLNRPFEGKEGKTFILDFVNDPDEVRKAFEPYYNTAQLEDVSDAQVVYDLMRKLNAAQIYQWQEVENFVYTFYDPKAKDSKLDYWIRPAQDRFQKRYQATIESVRNWESERRRAERQGDQAGQQRAEYELKEANETKQELELFKKDLNSFVRIYEFLSQVINYNDRDLEALAVFGRYLVPLLRLESIEEDSVDVSELQLTHYRIQKQAEHSLKLGEEQGEYALRPVSEVGSGTAREPEKKQLQEIIDKLNELFGQDIADEDQLNWARDLATRVGRHEHVRQQVEAYDIDQVMHGSLPKILEQIVIDSMQEREEMATKVLESNESFDALARLIVKLMKQGKEGSLS
ncbi:DEAD/DEAH box helicase family protein [Halorhodospira halochloris]|uniref:type I restriction endonuclease subunit R n=1 Tax=Halorhodospira halochloris TaxID=1052 RepID=UPI001EE7B91F|nr:type I restriction endonuclease [Halorhodospira halochloris]MCG5531279.1 DEAD/DEAH box helicase family protein [Halorhodospira halochloris]